MAISDNMVSSSKVFNASVTGTKQEVTDHSDVLIYSITILNATAAEAYFQVFDADADNVTVGTTTPTFVIGVDAASQLHCSFPKGIKFNTGFTVASTTSRAGSGTVTQEVTITYQSSSN